MVASLSAYTISGGYFFFEIARKKNLHSMIAGTKNMYISTFKCMIYTCFKS